LVNAFFLCTATAAPEAGVYQEPHDEVTVSSAAAPAPVENPGWTYGGFYVVTGVAPGTTMHLGGINPMLRYDAELGMEWTREKWAISFGAEPWLLQYYERRKVGGGLMGVITVSRRPVYVRFGAGSLTGIPASPDDDDYRPAVGGLAGIGLQGGGANVTGRFGVDYHIALDKSGRLTNTVMLTMRLKF
jgi:hypothetical protein